VPDIAGDSTTTSTIAVGSTLTGSIEVVSDHDWFRINLVAGQSISIVLNGIGGTPLGDPYLRIRDSAGNLLGQNDDGGPGLNSLLNFTASSTGTFYIDVSEYDSGVGDYQLQVNTFTPPPVASVNQFATQLASGYWDGNSHHFNVTQGGNLSVNLTALTSSGQNLARLALGQWADVIGISFVEVTSGGQILFDDDDDGASSSSTYSNGITSQSQVNVSVQWLTDYGTTINSYGYQTYIHEIGHALGLGHAGNYNSEATYATDALFANDGWPMSIMSYFSADESSFYASQNFTRSYLGTPMIADIAAMGMLYGLSTSTRAGATTYGFNSNAGPIFNASLYPTIAYTVFDSGGIDTLDFWAFHQDQLIDLGQGQFSNVGGRVGTVAIAVGTVIENAIGGSGNDIIRGNGAENTLTGNAGNDTFTGLGGNDVINGGFGSDTAVYANLFRAFSTNLANAGGTLASSAEGTDTLSSVELIRFLDGKFVFDADSAAAQVTRLYDTVLNRAPDPVGLDNWVDQIEDRGGSLNDVAQGFLGSVEFQQRTGQLSNADFVEFLYQNALGRASDPDGKANWVQRLSDGATRADLLVGFSESAEHRNVTAAFIGRGFFNTDDTYQSVALLYDSFAGRLPDRAGLINWSSAVNNGTLSLAQVASGFANSVEFHNLTGGMSHGQLVDFLYRNTLDREPDPAGRANWVGALDRGMSNADLLLGFSQSAEHFSLFGSHITNGIDYLA
jgi:hypothetical protein